MAPVCRRTRGFRTPAAVALICLSAIPLFHPVPSYSQVGPAEIADPALRSTEQSYLSQLVELNREVARIKFPFTFVLSRYAGLDPKQQVGADARGLEFVRFQGKVVLKLTGNYNAAYSAVLLTQNQRANRVAEEVIIPILELLPGRFSAHDHFDAFGFEIAYHVRTHGRGFEYEGKEILVLVMDKRDTLSFVRESGMKRQEILNRSGVYLNGKPFGLALGARDPFDTQALAQSVRPAREPDPSAGTASAQAAGQAAEADEGGTKPIVSRDPVIRLPKLPAPASNDPTESPALAAQPNADILQKKYQAQLNDLAADGVVKHHFVDYSPPSFVVFRNQIALQLTLKNPYLFDQEGTSIYKRAARSFDLFLAPQLKPILDKVPDSSEIGALDVTVINELVSKAGQSSEALEFVFPRKALRQFVEYAITNQDLIDQSVVLVNGVRIALNLQLVE